MANIEPPQLTDRMILEFERPIIDLEKKISELRGLSTETVDFSAEIRRLEQKARKLQKEVFADLSAQQKVQLARHPGRPYLLCLLYTSDAADERSSVDLGGRRIIKK